MRQIFTWFKSAWGSEHMYSVGHVSLWFTHVKPTKQLNLQTELHFPNLAAKEENVLPSSLAHIRKFSPKLYPTLP